MIIEIINNNKLKYSMYSLIALLTFANINLYSAATITSVVADNNTTRNQLALRDAARDGNVEEVQRLIKLGVDVNAATKFGETPLTLAVKYSKQKKIIELLLDAGADVNAADGHRDTALIVAVTRYKEIVPLLLNAGANVNASNKLGNTALILAANHGHKDIVELLLLAGADIDLENDKHKKAIDMADNQEIVKLLQDEPQRRLEFVNQWIENNRRDKKAPVSQISKEIAAASNLPLDISRIIPEYSIEYEDIPLQDRIGKK